MLLQDKFCLLKEWLNYFFSNSVLTFSSSLASKVSKLLYQARCLLHFWHAGQLVSSHIFLHFGHSAQVSKVFHRWLHVHCHKLSGVGFQLHFGHLISIFIYYFFKVEFSQILVLNNLKCPKFKILLALIIVILLNTFF